MNEKQAIDLVQRTFKSAFDRNNYIHFLKNLLNEFDEEGAHSNQGAWIPDKFKNYVDKLERVGKYLVDDHEVMLFIVYLKSNTSIERARTMQRNFVAAYLQKDMKDAALVAFVSKDPADWRFSFIKMEYRYDEQENKIREEFTPAKRWSFLVGANETSHTAQRKLVPIMADDEHNPTLAELEEAFNVEKVTKEFFEKYRDLFIRAKGELDKVVKANPKTKADFEYKGIDTTNLAKKLLGQIIFLYFLQKKGWFGVERDAAWGEGSRNFLRELFDKKHSDYKNFFNDILEPLFYEALRIDRSHDDHYYSRFNCKIPFLNGGLFDPMGGYDWVKTDILLSNELFHNKTKTKESDEGDGILDIFDRYNFTVKEDEPFEKEVAIDPELLGKAYEKFNAIRPDNFDEFRKALNSGKKGDESKFNKQYGVYYTPREIVHHMCQQSLINYLVTELEGKVSRDEIAMLILQGESLLEHEARAESNPSKTYQPILSEAIRNYAALIDEKLANIKVCDPAVGSGAFLVGMMSEIVRAREVLKTWTKTKQTTYDFKRHCIEHSLYGVDIDAGAVEIAKLRLWLSLVVDEDDIQNIKPLPNLDYKVVQGNSLVEILTENYLATDADTERTKFLFQLKRAKEELFNLTSPNQKEQKRREIDGLMQALFENYRDRQIRKLKEQLLGLKGSVRLAGFSDTKILKSDQAKVQAIEEQIKGIENLGLPDKTEHFEWRIIFSEVFEQNGGFDVVIGNPPYGAKISTDVLNKIRLRYPASIKGKVESYRIFIEKGIQITRSNGVLSYIVPNTWMFLEQAVSLRQYILKNMCLKSIVALPQSVFEATVDSIAFLLTTSLPVESTQTEVYEVPLKESMGNLSSYLQQGTQYVQLNWLKSEKSIITYGQNNASRDIIQKIKSKHKSFGEYVYIRQGLIPYLTKEDGEENKYISANRKEKSWSEYLDGSRCVDRYHLKGDISYIKYGNWLYAPREPEIFEKPRIIYQLIRNISLKRRIVATYLEKKLYSDRNTGLIFIKQESKLDPKYVLGIFNSSLLNFVHAKSHNSTYISFPSIESLPLAIAEPKVQREISKLVERILAAKRANPARGQADTSALEKEIDELVYQLYRLTEEEIKIVEGK